MFRRIFACLLLLSTFSFAQEPLPKEEQKLGRAKLDDIFELNIMGGLANKLIAYSIAYSHIVNDGEGEVNIPFTLWKDSYLPEDTAGTAIIRGPQNFIMGLGLKYRVYPAKIDEGLFYGGGMRLNYIVTSYEREISGSGWKEFEFQYENFIPHAELGYKYHFSTEWGLNFSGEAGYQFSTYDKITNLKGGVNGSPEGDPGRTPVYGKTDIFWTVNLGIFRAF